MSSFGLVLLPTLLLAASCADGGTARGSGGVADGTQVTLEVVSGDGQSAVRGTSLGESLVVRAIDAGGEPVANVVIGFEVESGGGSIWPNVVLTAENGVAATTGTLGPDIGEDNNTFVAFPGDKPMEVVRFTASGTPDPRETALQVGIASGNLQTARPGSVLPEPLVVQVVHPNGEPAEGTEVLFSVARGSGSVTESVTSDADGLAAANAVLGPEEGTQRFVATVEGATGSPLTFGAFAQSTGPVALLRVSGDLQQAPVDTELPEPLAVIALDDEGVPVAGVRVRFNVLSGGGRVTPVDVTTDDAGVATTRFTLGPLEGPQNVTSTGNGLDLIGPLFTAIAERGAADGIRPISGDGQVGLPNAALEQPMVVVVEDAGGNPVPGVELTFAAPDGGRVEPAGATTDSLGRAALSARLGDTAGAYRFTADASGLSGSPVTFTAEARESTALELIALSGDNQRAAVTAQLAEALEVQVLDADQQGVEGHPLRFRIVRGDATIGDASNSNPWLDVSTDADGKARVPLTLGRIAGEEHIEVWASAPGLIGSPARFIASADAGAALRLVKLGGDGQGGNPGSALGAPFRVAVLDALGNPVAGHTVDFAVQVGDGNVDPQSVETDEGGAAEASGVLGPNPQENRYAAEAFDADGNALKGSPVIFRAFADARPQARMAKIAGDSQTGDAGTLLPEPFVVQISDPDDQPLPLFPISFHVLEGGGRIESADVVTDADGLARAWLRLGDRVGSGVHRVQAQSAGVAGSPAVFSVTGRTGSADTLVITGGQGQLGEATRILSEPLATEVRDSEGNPVEGVLVTFTVLSGTGSVAPDQVRTGAGGRAATVMTLGPEPGPQVVAASATGVRNAPGLFVLTAEYGEGTTLVAESGDGQEGTVGQDLAEPFVIQVLDPAGNPVRGAPVELEATLGDGDIRPRRAITDGSGRVQGIGRLGPVAGQNRFSATIPGTLGPPAVFTATGLPGEASTLSLVSGDAQIGPRRTALPAPLVVQVSDALGNAVSGTEVAFSPVSGGGSVAPDVATTGLDGQAATVATLGDLAGEAAYSFAATADGLAGSPIIFRASGQGGVATELRKAGGDGQDGVVAQALAASITAEVVDAFGIPVPGVAVTFSARENSGGVEPARVVTDQAGLASTTATVGRDVGEYGFIARAEGVSGELLYIANAGPDAAHTIVRIAGDAQSGEVGRQLAQPLEVEVQDRFGNAVPGFSVRFEVLRGGGSADPDTVLTDAEGRARSVATLGRGAGVLAHEFTAVAGALEGSPVSFQATALPGEATTLLLAAGDGQTGTAGQPLSLPMEVEVQDRFGNPVSDISVSFSTVAGGGQVDPALTQTDSTGRARATAILGTRAGTGNHRFIARSPGLSGSPLTFTHNADAAEGATILLVGGDSQRGTAGQPLNQPLEVEVQDVFGNPVPAFSINFRVSAGGGNVNPTLQATGADGRARTTATLGTLAGEGVHQFAAAGPGLAGSPITFTASANPDNATRMVRIAGDAQSGEVDRPLAVPLEVEIQDDFGNPVAGVEVRFEVAAGDGGVSPPSMITGGDGRARSTATLGEEAGTALHRFNAITDGLQGSPLSFVADGTPGPAARMVPLGGGDQSAEVDNPLPQPLTVRIDDRFGNPVPDVEVRFAVTRGGGGVSPELVTTGDDGIARSTATVGTVAAVNGHGFQAAVDGLEGSPSAFDATAVSGPRAALVSVAGDGQSAEAGTALSTPLTVEVQDRFGNPVSGVTVTFSVSAGAGSVDPASADTDENGRAQSVATLGPVAGADIHRFSASVPGVTGSPLAFVASATPGAATALRRISGDGQRGVAGEPADEPLIVKVEDALGNGVPGVTVLFSVAEGGGEVSPAQVATDASGLASTVPTLGARSGTDNHRYQARAPGLDGSPADFVLSANPGPATSLARVSGDGQRGEVGLELAETLVVEARDRFANPVPDVVVSFNVIAGDGAVSDPQVLTDSDGRAAVAATLGEVSGEANNRFEASANGADASALQGSPVAFVASSDPGAAVSYEIARGNNQQGEVALALNAPFVVLARDRFGNPAPGQDIVFEDASFGGSLDPATVTTGANGEAASTYTVGTVARDDITISASALGLAGAPLTFEVTALAAAPVAIDIVSGNGQRGVVDTVLAQALQVRVSDRFDNDAPGATVRFATTLGNGAPADVEGNTDADGLVATSARLGTASGDDQHSYSATLVVDSVSGPSVSFTASADPDLPDHVRVAAGDSQSAVVATRLVTDVAFRVEDRFDNGVPNIQVAFTVGGAGSADPAAPLSDADGVATARVTLGTVTGDFEIEGRPGPMNAGVATVSFTALADVPVRIEAVSGDGQRGEVGLALAAPFQVRVRDQFDNPVPDVTVRFASSAGDGSIDPAQLDTDANGLASAIGTLGEQRGDNNNRFEASALAPDSTPLQDSPVVFTASADPGEATTLALARGDAQTGEVATALADAIVVIARDRFGNPVPGVDVGFSVADGNGSVDPAQIATNDQGEAATTATLGELAGAGHRFEAASGLLVGSPVSFAATALAAAPETIEIVSGDAQTGTVAQALAAPLIIRVRDRFGNPAPGANVAVSVTAGGGNVNTAALVTDASGEAQTAVTLGTTAGADNQGFQATLQNGAFVLPNVSFAASAMPAGPVEVRVLAGDAQAAVVDTALAAPVVAGVFDAFGNGVSGVSVSFAVSSAGVATPAQVDSDADGNVSSSVRLGTQSGAITITASSAQVPASVATFNATANPDIAVSVEIASGDAQSGAAGTTLGAPIVVLARDQFNNPVPGVTVDFAGATGGANTTDAQLQTGADGRASTEVTLGGAVGAGAQSATASSAGLAGSPLTFTFDTTPAPPDTLFTIAGTGQTGQAGADLPVDLLIELQDAFGNVVPGQLVRFEVTASNGSVRDSLATGTAIDVTTGADGRASVTATLGTVSGGSNFVVSVTVPAVASVPAATYTANTLPAAPQTLRLLTGSGQSCLVDAELATTLVFEIVDAFGNGVPSVDLDVAASAGAGVVVSGATTDASGQVTATATCGPVGGTDSFTATSAGLTGSPLQVDASVNHPVPTLDTIDPATLARGSATFTMTLDGSNFVADSVVRFDGADLDTTFVSRTQLTAEVPAAAVATPGDYAVLVFSPAPGGGSSASTNFNAFIPLEVTHLDPTLGDFAGGETVTVHGSGFVAPLTVTLDGLQATVNNVTATTIEIVTPAHAAGLVDVLVTLNDGRTAELQEGFRYFVEGGGFSTSVDYSVSSFPVAVAIGDITGNGENDILTVSTAAPNRITLLEGNNDGTFDTASFYGTLSNPSGIVISELTGDTNLDVVVSNKNANNVMLFRGNGTTSGALTLAATISTCTKPNRVELGDLDGDGCVDLIVPCEGAVGAPEIAVHRAVCNAATPNGTFLAAQTQAGAGKPTDVTVNNIDGAGSLDIAVANGSSLAQTIQTFPGNGDGTFGAASDLSVVSTTKPSVGSGDFTGDGVADLAVAGGNKLFVYANNGDGTFGNATQFTLPLFSTANNLAVGDINGDGVLDIAVVTTGVYKVVVYEGQHVGGFPTGAFTAAGTFDVGTVPQDIAIADLNHDTLPDLVIAAQFQSRVNVLLNAP